MQDFLLLKLYPAFYQKGSPVFNIMNTNTVEVFEINIQEAILNSMCGCSCIREITGQVVFFFFFK